MKKYSIILLLLMGLSFSLKSQVLLDLSAKVVAKKIGLINEKNDLLQGQQIRLTGCEKGISSGYVTVLKVRIEVDGVEHFIEYKEIEKLEFIVPSNSYQQWQLIKINSGTIQSLFSEGYQYSLREEMEEESLEFIYTIGTSNNFFYDDYLEDYLQGLVYKIHPIALEDGRPGNLSIRIMNNSNPNAFALPNGTIVITTGLISLVNSEAELVGILAHEIAHFVLDHQVINFNKQVERQKRADFWAGIATGIAAIGEVYLNTQSDVYTGGSLTYSAAVISTSIAQGITNRLGLEYSQEQERNADNAAKQILAQLGYKESSLSNVLTRLKSYHVMKGNYYALSEEGTHPSLDSRITAMGAPVDIESFNPDFQKMVSMVNTLNAIQEYNMLHLLSSEELVERNIKAQVATEDDYILKAIITRQLYDSKEKNEEALSYLEIAKDLNVNPRSSLYKQEAITFLRLKRTGEAKVALSMYLDNLYDFENPNEGIKEYIQREIEWTRAMIYKVEAL